MRKAVTTLTHFTTGLLLSVAFLIGGVTHDAPKGGFSGSEAERAVMHHGKPGNAPTWADHAQDFPGCVAVDAYPEGEIPAAAVVVYRDGSAGRTSLDDVADRANSQSAADDVWTVGACPR